MSYCTNCGCESNKKVCIQCGVKNKKLHNYCYFCGNALDPNAVICPNCKEYIKLPKKSFILDIILLLFSLFTFLLFFTLKETFKISFSKSYFFIILSIILALPAVKNIIRKYLYNKSSLLKKSINIGRYVLIIALAFASFAVFPTKEINSATNALNEELSKPVFSEEDAVNAAVNVFHNKIKLKNEDSFTINGTKVTELPPDENRIEQVWVEIDYSAQNGFGGYNRETKTIILEYNTESGQYTYSGLMY